MKKDLLKITESLEPTQAKEAIEKWLVSHGNQALRLRVCKKYILIEAP